MKGFFTNITSIFHKKLEHKAWTGVKYVLIHGYRKYKISHELGDEPFYRCSEFKTKDEVFKYLDEEVSKSDRKECRLYKEIKL